MCPGFCSKSPTFSRPQIHREREDPAWARLQGLPALIGIMSTSLAVLFRPLCRPSTSRLCKPRLRKPSLSSATFSTSPAEGSSTISTKKEEIDRALNLLTADATRLSYRSYRILVLAILCSVPYQPESRSQHPTPTEFSGMGLTFYQRQGIFHRSPLVHPSPHTPSPVHLTIPILLQSA